MKKNVIFLVFAFTITSVKCNWACTESKDCVGLEGAMCFKGMCVCSSGKQPNSEGTTCIDVAPYLWSNCTENSQCSGLVSGYHCDLQTKQCNCTKEFHYLKGRCWLSSLFGEKCSRSEQCYERLLPFSLTCTSGLCTCASGYYERQKGECRKIADSIGEECVVDDDCQIKNETKAVCNPGLLKCEKPSSVRFETKDQYYRLPASHDELAAADGKMAAEYYKMAIAQDNMALRNTEGVSCLENSDCTVNHTSCSPQRSCVCNAGYFPSDDKKTCIAEVGMPATAAECQANFARVKNGICDCPNGFFYEKGNRACKKPNRRFGESCVDDVGCFTFGREASCRTTSGGGSRTCSCDPETSVQDTTRQMCKTFNSVIGDTCMTEMDCPQEAVCNAGKTCECKADYMPSDSKKVCLKKNMGLGEACVQSSQCRSANSTCSGDKCTCMKNFFQKDDNCLLGIGGSCLKDEECKMEHTSCVLNTTSTADDSSWLLTDEQRENNATCRCSNDFVSLNDKVCISSVKEIGGKCQDDVQCWDWLGGDSVGCLEMSCQCRKGHHEREGRCWKKTALGHVCVVTPQCFTPAYSTRTECRNSLCQCQRGYATELNPDSCNGVSGLRGFSIGITIVSAFVIKLFS